MKIDTVRKNPYSISAKKWAGIEESIGCRSTPIPIKWLYLINENYNTSHLCCKFLKKNPMNEFSKKYNLNPIIGVMACESNKRTTDYLNQGSCNVFGENGKITKSLPLSIWLEDDIWAYIRERGLKIADIYHKGAKRTGCMFCGYGCQFKDDNRLQLCYDLYPKMYNYFMNYTNNGVTYREVMRKVLSVNGIELPDEKKQLTLF